MFFRRKEEPIRLTNPAVAVGPITSDPNGRPKKILIIDDDPVIVKTLSLTLQRHGYQVVSAMDGSEAISQIRDEQPDILLVDVCLPPDIAASGAFGWDGFQIAGWVRNLSCKAPTIVISGTDKPEYRQKATAVGAKAFLTKPIDKNLLLTSIASTLSHRGPAGSVN